MWLINTTTLKLKHFVDCRDPRINGYAILSHTWESGEVSFQEFKSGLGLEKAGYNKIKMTCTKARKNGLRYAWVDTCCINKESSAELNEAINSMWQWYLHSTRCYAYLVDVHKSSARPASCDGHDLREHEVARKRAYTSFARSRWFTRGWTLQELLAPNRVEFYDHHWNMIGSKRQLAGMLSQITGIDILALRDVHCLSEFVIARKMSWAAGRKTARIEDRAYSLLGLFGINMPLLYGEGEKAFIRLQEHLVQISTDHSVFAWEQNLQLDASLSNDFLFARSPDAYKRGRKMVRCEEIAADSPYRLTNRGVEFSAITLTGGDVRSVVLNCCLQDDFRGPLALVLVPRALHVSGESGLPKQYAIQRSASGPFHHKWGFSSELIVHCYSHKLDATTSLTLLRYDPFSQISRQVAVPSKVQIKMEGFTIVAAFPKQAWNCTTGEMCPPLTTESQGCIFGSLVLLSNRYEAQVVVAFAAPMRPEVMWTNGPPVMLAVVPLDEDPHNGSDWRPTQEVLDALKPTRAITISDDRRNHISASVYQSARMGGAVCFVITITFVPASGRASRGKVHSKPKFLSSALSRLVTKRRAAG